MSSDESRTTSSSRLSQFGLYRTIDARTEEFLRLSRKRQIRQGCACAAVSTAITVTVVVTVLLVYEYGINLDAKTDQKQSKKQNWFGLFNDSTAFDSKLNKAKINFDPSTLKLLPLIFKALGHNKFLEKILDDSSSNPIPTKKPAVDLTYNKNLYGYAKNKIVNPKSDFRTTQLQKDNSNYFIKARKMRDYQRVMKYFDKMVGDKLGTVTKAPVAVDGTDNDDAIDTTEVKEDKKEIFFETTTKFQTSNPSTTRLTASTRNPRKTTKISKQLNPIETITEDVNTTARQHRGTPTNGCKCPSHFNTLFAKLISAFQELLPEIVIAKSRCVEKNKTILPSKDIGKTQQKNITTTTLRTSKKPKPITKTTTVSTEPTVMATITNKWYYTYEMNKTTTEKSLESVLFHDLLMPDVIRKYVSNTNNFYINTINKPESKNNKEDIENVITNLHLGTTVKAYVDPPLTEKYLKPYATDPMKTYLSNTKRSTSEITHYEPTTINVNFETTTQSISSTLLSKKNTFKSFLNLDREHTENINKIIKKDKEHVTTATIEKFDTNDHSVNINDLKLFSLKRLGDLIIPSRLTTSKDFLVKIKPFISEKYPSIRNTYTTEASATLKIDSDLIPINVAKDKVPKNEKTYEEDERRVIPEDDIQVQEILKQVENIIKSPLYNKYSPTRSNMIDDDTKPAEVNGKKNENKLNKDKKDHNMGGVLNSMLPESRPTYLEINRHPDFKFEAPHDEYLIRNAYSQMT